MKILLAAEESAGIQALRAVADSDCELVAVMTSAPKGTKRGAVVSDVASKLGVEVWPAPQVKDPALAERIRAEEVDVLLNVHSLYIIHGDVVAAPRIGSFNLHPGPLPRYAGLNVPSWAIVNGEAKHAVTLHWMEAGLDTGAIAFEDWFDLDEKSTGLSASVQCARRGIELVQRLLNTLQRDPSTIPARAQDLSQRRTYRSRDVPYRGRVDWTLPARTLDAYVRAADYYPMPSPWGHPEARLQDRTVGVVKAARTGEPCDAPAGTVGAVAPKDARVATADEWVSLKLVCVDGAYVDPATVLEKGQRFEEEGS